LARWARLELATDGLENRCSVQLSYHRLLFALAEVTCRPGLDKGKSMNAEFVTVTCPSCFENFQVVAPPVEELPAELDYDCEVCCRPMLIVVEGDENGVWAEARGIND
jgi:hypothetical protein